VKTKPTTANVSHWTTTGADVTQAVNFQWVEVSPIRAFVNGLDREVLVALGKAEAERAILRLDVLERYAAYRKADTELTLAVAAKKPKAKAPRSAAKPPRPKGAR